MNRVDLYLTVHKGLRALMFAAVQRVGCADFACEREAAAAAAGLEELLCFLAEHAEHEDAAILPAVERIAPALASELHEEHVRTEGMALELAVLLRRLPGASQAERVALGRRIHERSLRLVAEHLRHMGREEDEANRALWAHHTDSELGAMEQRIVGSIPPERMADWLGFMLPAASRPERVQMLTGMRAAMPQPVFAELTGQARAALGEDEWSASLGAADASALAS